jgi:hypothetical protein
VSQLNPNPSSILILNSTIKFSPKFETKTFNLKPKFLKFLKFWGLEWLDLGFLAFKFERIALEF